MDQYGLFKTSILKKTGIDLSDYKEKQMKRRIEALALRRGFDRLTDYYEALEKDYRLYDEFLNYITINVSEFFRNPKQWEILKKEMIPYLAANKRNIKVWSCACSTGEEPYSLVMMLTEFFELEYIKVLATDIDEGAIAKAKEGIYKQNSLKNMESSLIKRFFNRNGDNYSISQAVKGKVVFKRLNLLKDGFPDQCDLILCRNVLIYFTEDAKQQIYRKLGDALSGTGILFVGSTEQIIMPQKYDFTPIRVFFYKKNK